MFPLLQMSQPLSDFRLIAVNRRMIQRTEAWELAKLSAGKWSGHNVPRLGASLAYYTLLSLAPLLILVVTICGLVFTKNTAEANVIQQARDIVGAGGATALKGVIDNAHEVKSGIIATIIALMTLLFGASGVFVELRDSLNTIWDVKAKGNSG